jgi:hypothetical protein
MDYQPKRFDDQTYECIVDMRSVYYIKEHFTELDLGEFYDEGRPTGKKVVDCKSEPALIMNFLDGFKRIKGTKWGRRIDTYSQSKKNPRRMTTKKMSIQGISRQIRHTLCRENQYDLDVDNCHPVLIKNWCDKKGIVCEQLIDWNNNRKERTRQIQEILGVVKDEAKRYNLSLLNGGGIIGKKNEEYMEKLKVLPWFLPYIEELKIIRGHVSLMYPDLKKMAIESRGKDYYNLYGTTISYLLTNLENQVLNIMINACIKRKVKISGTIYDGLQIYKDTVPDLEEFMRYLESEILTYSEYSMKISKKEMDEGIVIPDDYVDPDTREEQEKEAEKKRTEEENKQEKYKKEQVKKEKKQQKELEKHTKEEQRKLRKEAKKEEDEKKKDVPHAQEYLDEREGEIVYDKKMGYGYFYNASKRLWCQFKSFDSLDEDIIDTLGLESAKEIKNINLVVKRKLMNREDDLTKFNMKTGILALGESDIIDMRTLEVRPRVKTDLCSFYLSSTYKPEYDRKWVEQYIGQLLNVWTEEDQKETEKEEREFKAFMEKSLEEKFEDIQKAIEVFRNETYDEESQEKIKIREKKLNYVQQVLEMFGYIFTGENNLKIILMMLGKGDNGKSLFMEIVKILMEQYSTIANPKIFKKPRFENNTHEAHLYPLIGKRGAFISELSEGDEFNATVMKRASGNDPDSIRNSGSDLTLDVTLKAVLVAVSNEVPKNTDPVLWKRLKFINFANTFSRDSNKEKEIKDHKNDLFCAFMEGAHRYYQRGMTINYCEEIDKFTQDQRDSKDSFIAFSETYEIEESKDGKEYCKEVYQVYMDFCYNSKGEHKRDGKETFYAKFEKKYGFVKDKDAKGNFYRMKPIL